jgi:hypothetical protein
MTHYTVHAPPPRQGEVAPDPLALVFIKEGFSWPALFIPEVWLIFRRLWLVLAVDIAAIFGIVALSASIGGPVPVVIAVLLRLLFALEANGLRRWTCERHGYRLLGIVEGARLWEAELRYFVDWPFATSVPAPPVEPPPVQRPSAEAGEIIGLFPAPGGAA